MTFISSNSPPTTSRFRSLQLHFNKETGHIKDIFMSIVDPLLEELKANRYELAATKKAIREGENSEVISFIRRKG